MRPLALCLTFALSVPAFAQEPRNPAPAEKATPKDGATVPTSLRALEEGVQKHRLQALQRYIEARSDASDAGRAVATAAGLALELGEFEMAGRLAEQQLAKGAGAQAHEMRMIGASAAIAQNRDDDARRALTALLEEAQRENDLNTVVGATVQLAALLASGGDTAGARALFEKVAKDNAGVPQLGEYLRQKTAALDGVGKPAVPIEGTDLNGKPIRLADLKGKVVLLDFWATWCGPCVEEMPKLLRAYDRYHEQGFEILGISLDEDRDALTDFVAANDIRWPQSFDGKGWESPTAQAYGVQAIPATWLLDRDGNVHAVGLRGIDLVVAIASLVGKPAAQAK